MTEKQKTPAFRIYIGKISGIFISIFIDFFTAFTYTMCTEVNTMPNIASAIRDTISISLFNRGYAGKIFEEVKSTGAKVVMKNNTAECVLLSPDEYIRIMDEINDARLLTVATNRMSHYNPAATLSEEEMNIRLGLTSDDLADFEGVELE